MRHVTCPICGGTQGVAAPVAMQVQCAFCRSQFLVPAAPFAPGAPYATTSSPPHLAAMSPQPAPPLVAAEPEERFPAAAPVVPRGMWLEFTFFGIFAALFVAGLVVVLLVSGRWKPGGRAAQRVEEIVIVRRDEPNVEPRWSDATRISLQLDGVKTRIDHAEFGDVFARDSNRQVVTTKDKYLTIWVHVENYRAEPAEYRSWYGGRFERSTGAVTARLVDDQGVTYPLKTFDEVREVKGHVERGTLAKQDFLRDTLVFAVPERVRRSDVSYLRLELPGAAFGADGFLRFQIPLSLVEGW